MNLIRSALAFAWADLERVFAPTTPSPSVRFDLTADPRPIERACRGADARMRDASDPHRGDYRRITCRETVVRKALGEMD